MDAIDSFTCLCLPSYRGDLCEIGTAVSASANVTNCCTPPSHPRPPSPFPSNHRLQAPAGANSGATGRSPLPHSLLLLLWLFPMKTHLWGVGRSGRRRDAQAGPACALECGAVGDLEHADLLQGSQAAARIILRGQRAVCASVLTAAVEGSSNWHSLRMTAAELPRMVKGMCLLLHCLWGLGSPSVALGATVPHWPSCLPLFSGTSYGLSDLPHQHAPVTHEQGPLLSPPPHHYHDSCQSMPLWPTLLSPSPVQGKGLARENRASWHRAEADCGLLGLASPSASASGLGSAQGGCVLGCTPTSSPGAPQSWIPPWSGGGET